MKTKENKPKLTRRIHRNMLLATILAIGVLGGLWIWSEYAAFRMELETTQADLLDGYKTMLKNELDKALFYIDYQKTHVRSYLMNSIKSRVYEAHAIAGNIYQQYNDKVTPEELRKMVKDALRPVRFNEGRGYYFAFDIQGIETLFADRPEMEGTNMLSVQGGEGKYVVRDMLDIVRNRGEGFYEYTWSKPDRNGLFPKIAFVKVFEPFGWVIGTGEYLDDVEHDIQQEVIRFIEQIRYEKGGYIFAGKWDGVSLSGPAKGRNMYDVTDNNGLKIVQALIRLARDGGGYLRYVMPGLENKRPASKLAYVVGIPEWEWYVGTGVYIDEIDTALAQKRAGARAAIAGHLGKIALGLAGLLFMVFFGSLIISRKIERNLNTFSNFFNRAALDLNEIDPDRMDFAELQDLSRSANNMVRARKEAENTLRRQAALLEAQANSTTEGILVVDNHGKKVFQNQRTIELWGIPAHIVDNDDDQVQVRHVMHMTRYPEKFAEKVAYLYNHPDEIVQDEVELTNGKVLERYSAPVVGKDGRRYGRIWTFRDITDRRRAELENISLQTQLLQAQKMESIGTLAGGIAHDFNNILFPIVGYCEILLEELPHDQRLRHFVQIILDSTKRGAELVKQILAFSRQTQSNKVPVKVQEIVREVLALIRHSIPASIEIETDVDASCEPVMADPGQIHQVIMNLVTNANHAMAGSAGKLAIGLHGTDIGPEHSAEPDLAPGRYVDLYVSDTGVGMAATVINKIFDPFYTTKEVGKGTGLGLSVSYGIIREHHGAIQVTSTPGRGSTFHVYLPVTTFLPEEAAQPEISGGDGSESILLVDDDETIAEMLKSTLNKLGYKVMPHSNSLRALAAFRRDPDHVDLVITDMTMPDMTGAQLAGEIRRVRPSLPIILCTGFSEQIDEDKAKALGINAFLMKPVVRDQLAAAVRRVLDEKGGQ